ncbi:hypothetical protein [Nocardioides alkalitolerans]|uniref:hypothetical protein n=1 Tax=Nocardioides alkalitolerans TaxID=281714 RepID=UPI000419E701|nr:hypothetical protein [Nocardioides alkalitolerans]
MSTEAPTNGELVRRMEEVFARLTQQLEALTGEIREDRRVNERTYVRRDVYDAERAADKAARRDLEKDIAELVEARKSDAGFRRQVLLWGAGLTITVMVTIVVAVANLLAR